MNTIKLSRRDLLIHGSATVGLAWLHRPRQALAFPRWAGAEVIPWLVQPPANPMPQAVGNCSVGTARFVADAQRQILHRGTLQ